MQLAFSPGTQFAALAVANAIAIGVTSAQGPAPSPLLPQGAPAPSKEAAPPTQASPVPELTEADFEKLGIPLGDRKRLIISTVTGNTAKRCLKVS